LLSALKNYFNYLNLVCNCGKNGNGKKKTTVHLLSLDYVFIYFYKNFETFHCSIESIYRNKDKCQSICFTALVMLC